MVLDSIPYPHIVLNFLVFVPDYLLLNLLRLLLDVKRFIRFLDGRMLEFKLDFIP